MKKLFGLVLVCSVLFTSVNAQSDRFVFFGGMVYDQVSFTFTDPSSNASSNLPTIISFYGLTLGMDYILAHANDQASIGVNPNLMISLKQNGVGGLSPYIRVPVLFLGRIGAGSTSYNEQTIGIGAGIGGSFTYMGKVYFNDGVSSNYYPYSAAYITPTAVGEVTVNSNSSKYMVRLYVDLLPIEISNYRFGNSELNVRTTTWGLGFGYGF